MQVRRAAALEGWRWVTEGLKLLISQPIAIIGLTTLFVLSLVLPTIIPLVGGFAPLVLTPTLSVGFMQAVRDAQAGKRITPLTLFSGFRADKGRYIKPLLILGAINCILTVGVLAASMLADGGTLFRIFTGAIGTEEQVALGSSVVYSGAVFGLLYAPVQMAMWFAPIFVAWHGLSPVKALFYSLVAVWRNRWPFLVYMLGWFAIAVAWSVLIQVLKFAIDGSVLTLLLTPISLAMLGALYCSFWPVYRDLIVDAGLSSPPQDAPPTTPAI
jgi:hypothetical protein